MSDEIPVDGLTYVSSRRASEISGYAQDYIGQLARSGQIDAKRVGGLWYVYMDSLESYKSNSDTIKIAPREDQQASDADVLVSFDGNDYISANRASKITGYNQDYIGQLARSGKILARQVGNRWYVDRVGLLAHKNEKDALLAGVQAESVGIHPSTMPENAPANQSDMSTKHYAPLLTYVTEDADLKPRIEKEQKIGTDNDFGRHFDDSNRHDDKSEVPIRIMNKPIPVATRFISSRTPSIEIQSPIQRESKAKISLPLGFGILLCAAFIAAGPLFLNIRPADMNKATQITQNAAGGSLVNDLAGTFENMFIPELTYQRSK